MMKIEEIYEDLPILETDRLLLRKITIDDVEMMHAYASNEEVSKYVTWDTHYSLSDTQMFVEFVLHQYETKKIAPWGIEYKQNGTFIGTIDFVNWQPKHKIAEIGYVISSDYWGNGITPEAANALLKYGFENMDLVRIQAKCLVENNASARVMEKIGMSFEGIIRKGIYAKGKHHDLKLYSILDHEYFAI